MIIDEIKKQFSEGNIITRLIIINLSVFVTLHLVELFLFLFKLEGITTNCDYAISPILKFLALPAKLSGLIFKPWTMFTYMFLHESFWHILMNMLVLFFSGQVFLLFLNPKQLLGVYLGGGFFGGLLYVLAYNIFPIFDEKIACSICLGASASIMAILAAAATISPNYKVNLMFIGPVALKYIAIFYFILDIINIRSGNSGGHLAHIGGALFGFMYIKQLQKGKDWALVFNAIVDTFLSFFQGFLRQKPKMKVAYKKPIKDEDYNTNKKYNQDKIDAILDKISKSGYESLTGEEKDFLFNMHNKK
jgi:membrane associated rhomboid family serine protease